jgi:hypothetical protein
MHGGVVQKIERRVRDWIVVTSLGSIKTTTKRHVKNGGRSAERTRSMNLVAPTAAGLSRDCVGYGDTLLNPLSEDMKAGVRAQHHSTFL